MSAWMPRTTPRSRRERTRTRHVDSAMPTSRASIALDMRPSCSSRRTRARSVGSSGLTSRGFFGTCTGYAATHPERPAPACSFFGRLDLYAQHLHHMAMDAERFTVETRAVHAGRADLTALGVHVPPIDLSTTYPLPDV